VLCACARRRCGWCERPRLAAYWLLAGVL
jgi:hypothetical protein